MSAQRGDGAGREVADDRRGRADALLTTVPYSRPWHPVFTTVPAGAWLSSLVFDVASRLAVQGHPFVIGSRWLIGIGLAGALVAAVVGLFDLAATIAPHTAEFRTGMVHLSVSGTMVVLYVVNFAWRITDAALDAVPTGQVALSVAGFVLLGTTGYLGGKLAHRYNNPHRRRTS